ncbi:MAG: alpha/beta hydrolase [Streptosporangiales bacterium]|nr:alpha/beta hydrolase [Streptosporangiales bacterium]
MANTDGAGGRIRLRRDSQQWAFDRFVNETGRVFHWQQNGRGRLPAAVKQHDMISKHVGRSAAALERIAKSEAEAGHDLTALEFYFDAASAYAQAQHPVFALNDEKRHLHGGVLRCYDEVRRLAPTPIEKIDVPFEGNTVSGYLHLAPVDGPAPLVFFIPGCDMTKEMVPHPLFNFATSRGMHLFVFDGPGQGESNLRGLRLTLDNYERAASAALTELLARPEVDESRVGLYSLSFGSYWGARFAATDHRIAATVILWASISDKYYLLEEESPRYKQLFAFMTGLESEAELDTFRDNLALESVLPEIVGPTLFTIGQYDPRSPLEDVYRLVDTVTAPTELWVFEDQHHNTNMKASFATQWLGDHHSMSADWLKDRLDGKPIAQPGETKWIAPKGHSPNDPAVPRKRHWFD